MVVLIVTKLIAKHTQKGFKEHNGFVSYLLEVKSFLRIRGISAMVASNFVYIILANQYIIMFFHAILE